MITKIVSGGQTGPDSIALKLALDLGLNYGGWCPQGRMNENGKIEEKYDRLREVPGFFKKVQDNYDARTRRNVRDSDGTLILLPQDPLPKEIQDGTRLTIEEAKKQKKPFLLVDLSQPNENKVIHWVKENRIATLNIAGPRESSSQGISALSLAFLQKVLPQIIDPPRPRL
jgi:Circularly permutated YpsA SLOG family